MDIFNRLFALFIVASPIVVGKISDKITFTNVELLSIWLATLFFVCTPKEIKDIINLFISRVSDIKSVKGNGFGIDFNIDDKTEEVEREITSLESMQSSKTRTDISNYSEVIFEKVKDKTNNPLEALTEAKKYVIENIQQIATDKDPNINRQTPAFSERTLLRIIGNYNESDTQNIDAKINSLIKDLNHISKLEINQQSFDADNILYIAELYSRLACVLYGEKIKLRAQAGIPSPKPEQPLETKGIVPSAVSFSESVLYASISIVDSNGRLFPIKQDLDRQNFEIYETRNSTKSPPLPVLSVIPTLKTKLPIRITFIIDNSMSMNTEIPGSSTKKITMAKKSLTYLIDQLSEKFINHQDLLVSVLTFKDKGCDFITKSTNGIWSNSVNILKTSIQKLDLSGNGTPLWDTINSAIDSVKNEPGYKIIICLTDGEDNRSNAINIEELVKKSRESSVPIYNICYGSQNSDATNLGMISKSSGAGDIGCGFFVDNECDSLPNIFNDIGDTIAYSYVVSWRSQNIASAINEPVNVLVNVSYESYKLSFSGSYYASIKDDEQPL